MSPGAFFALSIGTLTLVIVGVVFTLRSSRFSYTALLCIAFAIAGISLMLTAR